MNDERDPETREPRRDALHGARGRPEPPRCRLRPPPAASARGRSPRSATSSGNRRCARSRTSTTTASAPSARSRTSTAAAKETCCATSCRFDNLERVITRWSGPDAERRRHRDGREDGAKLFEDTRSAASAGKRIGGGAAASTPTSTRRSRRSSASIPPAPSRRSSCPATSSASASCGPAMVAVPERPLRRRRPRRGRDGHQPCHNASPPAIFPHERRSSVHHGEDHRHRPRHHQQLRGDHRGRRPVVIPNKGGPHDALDRGLPALRRAPVGRWPSASRCRTREHHRLGEAHHGAVVLVRGGAQAASSAWRTASCRATTATPGSRSASASSPPEVSAAVLWR